MTYFITFLEGIISFISPCMLPMLPVYLSYFGANAVTADTTQNATAKRSPVLLRAAAFVVGFTVVFCALGVFAGTLGTFLTRYRTAVNVISGIIVILLGLSYLDVFHLPFFSGMRGGHRADTVFSAFLFGIIYSVSLTPCVGAFLGSALMLASGGGGAVQGAVLLLCYSLGLGIPFLLSTLLLDRLAGTFRFIKSHYRIINLVCGIFLIVIGICMTFGWLNAVMALFS